MKKIFVVGNATNYASWMKDSELTDNLEEANIVLFTGGEDVDPSLYNCEKHYTTYSNLNRDLAEKAVFEKVRPNQLCLGICRGSQFLCVMNGGLLVQNVNNHALRETHQIVDSLGLTRYDITSTHHQMQYPFNLPKSDYKLLYYSSRRSDYYEGCNIDIPPYEPEIVLYCKADKPKCLAIQGHPEYMRKEAPVLNMLNDLIDKYVE